MLDPLFFSGVFDTRFLAASFLIIVAPGPALFFILGTSVAQGSRQGVAAAFGVTLGATPHVAAASLGLAAVVEAHPIVFDCIKIAGGAYLSYLGFMLLRDALERRSTGRVKTDGGVGRSITAGAFISLASPQLTLFFLSFFPTFVNPVYGEQAYGFAVLGVTFLILALAVLSILGAIASFARYPALRSRGFERAASLFASFVFLSIGVDALFGVI